MEDTAEILQGIGVLLAIVWAVDLQTPRIVRGAPNPAGAHEKPQHALALVHRLFPHDLGHEKEFTPFPRYGWALEQVNCLKGLVSQTKQSALGPVQFAVSASQEKISWPQNKGNTLLGQAKSTLPPSSEEPARRPEVQRCFQTDKTQEVKETYN